MSCTLCKSIAFGSSLLVASLLYNGSAVAQTVWSGLTKSFSKASFTDDTLPENQDPLTGDVKLTRGSSGGIINIASESVFDQSASPALTEWATGLNNASQTIAATNWRNLAFTDWLDAYGGAGSHGSLIAGRNAVVHLISDNLYLDLKFTSWTSGNGSGYAYLRAEPTAISPTGDYNGNGVVDAADYVVWRLTSGQTGVPLGSGADGNANGAIDPGDYAFWRGRFGNSVGGSGSGNAAVVPEPGTLIMLLGAVVALGFRRSASDS